MNCSSILLVKIVVCQNCYLACLGKKMLYKKKLRGQVVIKGCGIFFGGMITLGLQTSLYTEPSQYLLPSVKTVLGLRPGSN